MPWRIPSACWPRCIGKVRVASLASIRPACDRSLTTDKDAETLGPRGEADVPLGIVVYAGCQDELRRLYDDQRR